MVTEVLGLVKGAYCITDRHTGRSVQCPLWVRSGHHALPSVRFAAKTVIQ